MRRRARRAVMRSVISSSAFVALPEASATRPKWKIASALAQRGLALKTLFKGNAVVETRVTAGPGGCARLPLGFSAMERSEVVTVLMLAMCAGACSGHGGDESEPDPVVPAATPSGGTPLGGMASGTPGGMASGTPEIPAGEAGTELGGTSSVPTSPPGDEGDVEAPIVPTTPTSEEPRRQLSSVLVFTRTALYRHESIPAGVEAIRGLGDAHGFVVQQTEDPATFDDASLMAHQVVVWLSTTADVLSEPQQAAFERYIAAGNGWVGVHAAADTEYAWPWYGGLIGGNAWFLDHPEIQTASLVVEQAEHPSTTHLPQTFQMRDEWYNFQQNPRSQVNVLLRLDESSYQAGAGAMGADHPIAWYHEYSGGRAWYTALGHSAELYSDPRFVDHLLGGIRWAAGVSD